MKKRVFPFPYLLGLFVFLTSCSDKETFEIQATPSDYVISYNKSMPTGMVGDGKDVFLVQSGTIKNKNSREDFLPFIFKKDTFELALNSDKGTASFFPGGVIYSFSKEGIQFEIIHACLKDDPYVCFIKTKNVDGQITSPQRQSLNQQITEGENGEYILYKFATKESSLGYSWAALQNNAMQPYIAEGMILESPSAEINKAVAFSQFLLDLGYNDELIVCELFRYRDIWSRDLGSGFGPGALFTNRVESAKNCIYYDMDRYVKSTASALKTTNDASKGGSAEGTAWLTETLWDYYLITGDKAFLKEGANDIRPFVETWIARDYNEDGVIVDVTEWMDHSRHYLLPYGSTTTYSNALMVTLLKTFSKIENELGNQSASNRYASLANTFANGIDEKLWSDEAQAYANLQVNGVQDLRTASAANALAILAGIPNDDRTAQIFKTLEEKNWKESGSMTITPRTTHVDSDQNEKIWPWWNAVEAMARFQNNNIDGGLRLLENCAATIDIERFPGLMEEILDKDGEAEGGSTFVTGAGAFLTAVYKGLFGIDIVQPGMKKMRIQPNIPADWKNLKAKLPTPNGYYVISLTEGKLHIGVFDDTIKEVEVNEGVEVEGAKAIPISDTEISTEIVESSVSVPEIKKRKAAVFREKGIPFKNRNLDFPKVSLDDLSKIDDMTYEAIIFTTNAIPALTTNGTKLSSVLEKYIEKGGAIIFYGASMKTLDGYYAIKMGLQGGVIEWYKKEKNKWKPYNSKQDSITKEPVRGGTVYWGEGHYFNSWDVQQGLFGFSANGKGLKSQFKSLQNNDIDVTEVFSDFAVSKPYYFQSIADTHTNFNFMYPQKGEWLSCFTRIVNTETKGEFVLIAKSVVEQINPSEINSILGLY